MSARCVARSLRPGSIARLEGPARRPALRKMPKPDPSLALVAFFTGSPLRSASLRAGFFTRFFNAACVAGLVRLGLKRLAGPPPLTCWRSSASWASFHRRAKIAAVILPAAIWRGDTSKEDVSDGKSAVATGDRRHE